jgi:hypothetical protein
MTTVLRVFLAIIELAGTFLAISFLNLYFQRDLNFADRKIPWLKTQATY